MEKERRTAVYDAALKIEAYRFEGFVRPFPNHFHEYYVIGFVERGERCLSCKNQDYTLRPGHVVLFQPGDNHACVQRGGTLDYRALNIPQAVMLDLTEEIAGERVLPGFSETVIEDGEIACTLRRLHALIMAGEGGLEKEEQLLLLTAALLERYGQPFARGMPECRAELEKACVFMERNYARHLDLEQISHSAGLSKSALLRAFTRSKGVTPYRYLEALRISEAKKQLQQGATPLEAAMRTGFSDQSHFTNYFNRFIGLPPGAYRDIFQDGGGERHGE